MPGEAPDVVAHDPDDAPKAEDAKAALKLAINEYINHQIQAILFDACLIEIQWDLVDGIWKAHPVKRFKPVHIEKVDDYSVNILSDEVRVSRQRSVSTNLTEPEFIIDISDDDEPGGLLTPIAHQEVLLIANWKEWANFNAKLKGILQALYREGAVDAEVRAAREAAQTAVRNNFIVASDAVDFKLHEITSGTGSSFGEMIKALNANISIAILGQANTSELGPSGSRAALEVLNLIRADIHYADIERVTNIINSQILRFYQDRMFGAGRDIMAFQINIPEEEDLEKRTRAISDLYDSGIPLVADEAYRIAGLSKPDSVGDILVKNDAMS